MSEREAAAAASAVAITAAAAVSAKKPAPVSYGEHPIDEVIEETVRPASGKASAAVSAKDETPTKREQTKAAKEFVKYTEKREYILEKRRAEAVELERAAEADSAKAVAAKSAKASEVDYSVPDEAEVYPKADKPVAEPKRRFVIHEEFEQKKKSSDEIEKAEKALERADAKAFVKYSKLRDDAIAAKQSGESVKLSTPYTVAKEELGDDALTAHGGERAMPELSGKDAAKYKSYDDKRDRLIRLEERMKQLARAEADIYEAPDEGGYDAEEAIRRDMEVLYPELGSDKLTPAAIRLKEHELKLIEGQNEREKRAVQYGEALRLAREEKRIEFAKARRERLDDGAGADRDLPPIPLLMLDKAKLTKVMRESKALDERYMSVKMSSAVSELEFKKDTARLDFTVLSKAERQAKREGENDFRRARHLKPLAIKSEKADNERYYSFATEDVLSKGYAKTKDTEAIVELRRQAVELLLRRDEINRRLIELYLGGSMSTDISAAADSKDKKAQKRAHRRLRGLKNAIGRRKVHRRYRDMLYDIMDEQVELSGSIARSKYALRRRGLKGRALREEKKALRKNKLNYQKNKAILNRTKGIAFRDAADRRAKRRDMIFAWLLLILLGGAAAVIWWKWSSVIAIAKSLFPFLGGVFPG